MLKSPIFFFSLKFITVRLKIRPNFTVKSYELSAIFLYMWSRRAEQMSGSFCIGWPRCQSNNANPSIKTVTSIIHPSPLQEKLEVQQ